MRIAFITTEYVSEEYFAGGLANYLYKIVSALKKTGHDPEIFVSSEKEEDIMHEGIIVHRVMSSLRNDCGEGYCSWLLDSELLNGRLQKVHSQKPFDIVQYSNWRATGFFCLKDIPSVTRLSSIQSLWRNNSNDNLNNIKFETKEEKMEMIAIGQSDAVLSPSYFLENYVKSILHDNVVVIETPFEKEVGELDGSIYKKYLKNKRYLLFFGRISENKGCIEISEIIYDILKYDLNLNFVFVGGDSGENYLIKRIINKAKEFSDRVIYISALRHNLLYPIVDNSYAVVLPSRIENLSNACIEAMARKKIVIGPNGVSFDQLIDDKKSGFLFEVGNSNDLLKKIKEALLIDEIQKRNIEEKAYNRIKDLNSEKIVLQTLFFYKDVIKNFSKKEKFFRISFEKIFFLMKKKCKKERFENLC